MNKANETIRHPSLDWYTWDDAKLREYFDSYVAELKQIGADPDLIVNVQCFGDEFCRKQTLHREAMKILLKELERIEEYEIKEAKLIRIFKLVMFGFGVFGITGLILQAIFS